ncbi:ParA family protein [Periweissella cryptocerci]|uniref:ParA family protein n=1 Tax=Periweissella cryptocerci TaxID=2506420 RepID=A0A4P6YQU3_9LACO|nr:ParA family protein [Periweissella cryptocerci]QBO34952.1 ParA family protein [Periweissella cryptocerci]
MSNSTETFGLTVGTDKGGTGKTTNTMHFSYWVSRHYSNVVNRNLRVLLLDLDYQTNLSQRFNVYATEHTAAGIFNPHYGDVKIVKVREHIDLVPGSVFMSAINKEIDSEPNKLWLIYNWIKENVNPDAYDFIIYDTHPDFENTIQAALLASDNILIPIEQDEDSQGGADTILINIKNLKQKMYNHKYGVSEVTVKPILLANKMHHNTKLSRELKAKIGEVENLLAYVPFRTVFDTAQKMKMTVWEYYEAYPKLLDSSAKKFLQELDTAYQTVFDAITDGQL